MFPELLHTLKWMSLSGKPTKSLVVGSYVTALTNESSCPGNKGKTAMSVEADSMVSSITDTAAMVYTVTGPGSFMALLYLNL